MPRTSRRPRNAGALVLTVVLALALGACGDDGDGTSPTPTSSSSAAATPTAPTGAPVSPSATPVRSEREDVTLDATASGSVDGRLAVVDSMGCVVVDDPAPGTLLSTTFAVTLTGGQRATLVVGVAKAGPTTFAGEASGIVLLVGDQILATSNPGGSGKADVSADGTEGTFEGRLTGSSTAEVKGSFTCR